MAKIQIKRGVQEAVEKLVLAEGEFALAKNTGNVYIGTASGTVHVNKPTATASDTATRLATKRNFKITGDGIALPAEFDGTSDVNLSFALNAMAGLAPGTYSKVTVDAKGRVTAGTTIAITDLPDAIPASKITGLPTQVSKFTNDSGYQTAAQVASSVAALVDTAPEALNTLRELATALGNDPNFATSVTNNLAGKESLIKNAVEKTGIVDADTMPISDSATTMTTKKITFAILKTTLKTYFDTLYNKYTHPTYTAKASGLYKVTVDATGHVSAVDPVIKADITSLGIPAQDTVYTLPTASATVIGGVKIGAGLAMAQGVVSVGDIDGGTF